MRLLVCGGRRYTDRATLTACLEALQPTVVITGGALGADAMADWWAQLNGVRTETYRADWLHHGKAAGPLRNARMLVESRPDAVLAFPGGAGTADMVRRALAASVPVIR